MEALKANSKYVYMLRELLQDANYTTQNLSWFTFLLQGCSELRVTLTFQTLKPQEALRMLSYLVFKITPQERVDIIIIIPI